MGRQEGRREALLPVLLTTVLTSLGVTCLVLVGTIRLTLLNPRFDRSVVADTGAYERLYTEVLPAPDAQRVLRAALADLPVDATYVTANLRLLLPPPVLEEVGTRALASYVRTVLGGDQQGGDKQGGDQQGGDSLRVLQPLLDHLVALVHDLLPGLVAAGRPITERSLAGFGRALDDLLVQLGDGRVPLSLPVLPVPGVLTPGLTALLTSLLPTGSVVRPQVELLLGAGDLTGALALVLPEQLARDPGLADRVRGNLSALIASAQRPLEASGHRSPESALPVGLPGLTALGGGCLLLVAVLQLRRRPSNWPGSWPISWSLSWRSLTISLSTAGVVALLVGLALEPRLSDPVQRLLTGTSVPPSAALLAHDIDAALHEGVVTTYLELVGVVVLAGLTAGAVGLSRGRSRRGGLPSVGCAVLATVLLVLAVRPEPVAVTTCNGEARLCSRTYDQVTYLTAHNAMASSDQGFFSAGQDVDVISQLDSGVRGLMLDVHAWTTPQQVADYLADLPTPSRALLTPVTTTFAPRKGLWLCHVICQVGSRPALGELIRIRDWLRSHPDAVVTLILEDHVPGEQISRLLADAGLDAFAATPPTGGEPWPTLGSMVRTGKRLMTFTERAHATAGTLRNLYDYAAETPYAATSVQALSCSRGRGPEVGSLFLLNHWVSTAAPSRAEAYAINRREPLVARVRRCQLERGQRPTFVAVDFAQIGQPLDAVALLNR